MCGNILLLGKKIFEIPPFFGTRPGDLGKQVHACSLRFSALKSGPRQPRPQGALRLGPRNFFLNLGCRKCHPAFSAGHSQSIKTKGNAVISCSLYPISGVIVKVQCLRQKRAKQ